MDFARLCLGSGLQMPPGEFWICVYLFEGLWGKKNKIPGEEAMTVGGCKDAKRDPGILNLGPLRALRRFAIN